MKRFLFVDDDRRLIQGLRRMLLADRRRWEMDFAVGGPEALELLRARDYDLVCTDMRMPDLDGNQLLEEVRRLRPGAVRIVLSGHADVTSSLEAATVAHLFLPKPCDRERLRGLLERACLLLDALPDPGLRAEIAGLVHLPLLPGTWERLEAVLRRPEAGPAQALPLVEQDPALAAKILQLVHSAFFGLAHAVNSLEQAVGYLGVGVLREMVLSHPVLRPPRPTEAGAWPPGLSGHSVLVAQVARHLVIAPSLREHAYLTGLLHDVGRLLLATVREEDYARVLATRAADEDLAAAERRGLGCDHGRVGAYLLGIWGLPEPLVQAVGRHHDPSAVHDRGPVETALRAADYLVDRHLGHELGLESSRPGLPPSLQDSLLPPRWEQAGREFLDRICQEVIA